AHVAEQGGGGRTGLHPVADAAHLDQQLAVGGALQQGASQRADPAAHARTGRPLPASAARLTGAWARWHSARAAAAAPPAGEGTTARPRRVCTSRPAWSLSARPSPATACFTWVGVYSTTSAPAAWASAMARPLACPTAMAVRTLAWKNTRSTATTAGPVSA